MNNKKLKNKILMVIFFILKSFYYCSIEDTIENKNNISSILDTSSINFIIKNNKKNLDTSETLIQFSKKKGFKISKKKFFSIQNFTENNQLNKHIKNPSGLIFFLNFFSLILLVEITVKSPTVNEEKKNSQCPGKSVYFIIVVLTSPVKHAHQFKKEQDFFLLMKEQIGIM